MADICFLSGASADYYDAFDWYSERSERAATGFERAVDKALAEIVQSPNAWMLCDDRHRVHLVRRYPYSIVYRIEGDTILIVAIAHGSRRSRYWQDRD